MDLALRYLGLGSPTVVPSDSQGRIDAAELDCALDRALAHGPRPRSWCACRPETSIPAPSTPSPRPSQCRKAHGAWVHVDGAFGLWAAAVPELAGLTAGLDRADSWATDAHKSLNVPYDCGVAVVRDAAAMRSAMGVTPAT